MADIVKYSNTMNKYPVFKLLEVEQDIFMALLSKTTFSTNQTIHTNLRELQLLVGYARTSIDEFERQANNLILKICNPKFSLISDDKIVVFVCFDRLEYDRHTKDLTVHIQDDFFEMMKNYRLGFTRFELAEFVCLSGNYAKTLYRLLKQWRTKGIKSFTIEEFREYLNIPESYRQRDIDKQIINPCIKQLANPIDMIDEATGCKRVPFCNLKVEKTKKRGRGKGGAVDELIFTWDREQPKKKRKAEQPQLIQTTKPKPKPKRKKLQDEQGRPLAEGYRRDENGNLVPDLHF